MSRRPSKPPSASDQAKIAEFSNFLQRIEGRNRRDRLFDADLARCCPTIKRRDEIYAKATGELY